MSWISCFYLQVKYYFKLYIYIYIYIYIYRERERERERERDCFSKKVFQQNAILKRKFLLPSHIFL